MTVEPFLTYEVRSAIIRHMNDFPNVEACGVIEKRKNDYVYVPCDNVHPDSGKPGDDGQPQDLFRFDAKTTARIRSAKSNVVAYVHTHPNGPAYPSRFDQEMQISINKPSVIACRTPETGILEIFSFGDHLLELPLEHRAFRHAVQDCWEAVRAWKFQNEGEVLDRFPREDRWWEVGVETNGQHNEKIGENEDMYSRNFASQGYEEFYPNFDDHTSPLHPRRGDVILMQLDAPVINHAAVYEGDNTIYHHRMQKKSGTNALGYLMDNGYVRKWLRRSEKSQ